MNRIPNIISGLEGLSAKPWPTISRASHFYDERIKIYARFGQRYVTPSRAHGWFFTLATFDVDREEDRNQGLFKEVVTATESLVARLPDVVGVFIESINALELLPAVQRLGYHPREDTNHYKTGYGGDWFKIINPRASSQPSKPIDLERGQVLSPGQIHWVVIEEGKPELIRIEEPAWEEGGVRFFFTRINVAGSYPLREKRVRFLDPVAIPECHVPATQGQP